MWNTHLWVMMPSNNFQEWQNNDEIQDIISKHQNDDIKSLAFSLSKLQPDKRSFILNQIQGRNKAKTKIPFLSDIQGIIFPQGISLEQSSSEATARYKASKQTGKKCIDLTGGFGIDSYFFSKQFEEVIVLEKNQELFQISKHNFEVLGADNVRIYNKTAEEFLGDFNEKVDMIFVDPSRRNMNKKVFLIEDSSPNLLEILPKLKQLANEVLVKLSPMLDLSQIIKTLPNLSAIEVVSSQGECKEILVSFNENSFDGTVVCTDLDKARNQYRFSLFEESSLSGKTGEMNRYAYIPNASVMKAGAFKSLTKDFKVEAISLNTHLYTSNELIKSFPGKKYECLATTNYNKESLYRTSDDRSFNIVKRNFPDDVKKIAKKLGIGNSGNNYLFCYSDSNKKALLSICRLIDV